MLEGPIQERDWKYLRSIQTELLNELCSRILTEAGRIAAREEGTPHEKYLKLHRYIGKSDDIVAECFDDWRRSKISHRILALRHHKMLTDEHVKQMSQKAQDWLRMVESIL
jgi:hypothetical protein